MPRSKGFKQGIRRDEAMIRSWMTLEITSGFKEEETVAGRMEMF